MRILPAEASVSYLKYTVVAAAIAIQVSDCTRVVLRFVFGDADPCRKLFVRHFVDIPKLPCEFASLVNLTGNGDDEAEKQDYG